MAENISIDFDSNADEVAKKVKALATALEGAGDAMREAGNTAGANKLDRYERSLAGIGKAANKSAEGLKNLQKAQLSVYKQGSLEIAQANPETYKLDKAGNARYTATGRTVSGADVAAQVAQVRAAKEAQVALARVAQEQKALQVAQIASAKGAMDHANRLTNLRYSLYDVSRSLTVFGIGLGVANIATLKLAADYETAMAQISRTSDVSGQQLVNLRQEFIGLAQTIPVAFDELAKIGVLGGQLNIPANSLAEFTSVVAQFTATTNVAAESSATAFGRLDALLPDVQGNYEALGSSILKVGVNSVATESEIIATTNQIAAAGAQAGFTSKAVIGLAASYASLGVAPEAARGTTIRLFSTINTAISENNANLETLAGLSGKTAEQFKQDWNENTASGFQDLITGMKAASESGTNLEQVIRSMGITAVRDINALLKLGQNAEIVADNFMYAADGFDQATALGDAFAIQAATLSSKVTMLVESFKALFAEIGQSGLGPMGVLVDILKNIVVAITEVAKSPFAQWVAAVTGGMTAVVAIGALMGAGLVRLGAGAIAAGQAISTMRYEVLAAGGAMNFLKGSTDAANGSMLAGAGVASKLKVALLGLGVVGAISLAIGAAAQAVDTLSKAMRSNADVARDTFGEIQGLQDAIKLDNADGYKGEEYGTIRTEIVGVTEAQAAWAQKMEEGTGVAVSYKDAIDKTSESLGFMSLKYGENARAAVANMLANNDAIIELIQNAEKLAAVSADAPVLDSVGMLTKLAENDTKGALAIYQAYQDKVTAFEAQGNNFSEFGTEIIAVSNDARTLESALAGVGEEIANGATQIEVTTALNEALGITADSTADSIDEESSSLSVLAQSLSTVKSQIEAGFENQNVFADMANSVYQLASGVYESGTAFDYLSQAGIGNMQNLQTAVVQTIVAGQALGLNTAESVAVLFSQLQAMGVDTANLMATVAAAAGVSVSAVSAAMGAPTQGMDMFANSMQVAAQEAQYMAQSVGGSGGGGAPSVADAAKTATKEVRTLVDWANDLSSVFDRAFDIRFGVEESSDAIADSWAQVKEETEAARANIKRLNAEQSTLKADNGSLKAQLKIAEMYGDTTRAAELRAQIGENDTKIAANAKELREEQAKLSKTTKGNTQAARDNRATLRNLSQQYQQNIADYAAAGHTQKEVEKYAKAAKIEFEKQAKQLGFSKTAVDKYSDAFDDVGKIIRDLPANVTTKYNANTSAAEIALREWRDKQKTIGQQSAANLKKGYSAGLKNFPRPSIPLATPMTWKQWVQQNMRGISASASGAAWEAYISKGRARYNQYLKGYEAGGYTGNVGRKTEAGVVHGREFVVNAPNTAKFRPILEQMNKGKLPMTNASSPMPNQMMVELSAYDRKLLAAAGNVVLKIGTQTLSAATNAGNAVQATRGSN